MRADKRREPATQQTTVFKLVRLIEAVAANEDGVGVRELARSTGIDKSAISRLFGQLETLELVEKSELTGRYRVGPRLVTIAAKVHLRSSLWQAAEPVLRRLALQFNETCYLTVREGPGVVFHEKIDCDRPIRYVIELGQVTPLHAGAGGRAILAGLPPEEVDRVLAETQLGAITSNTITDPDTLRSRIAEDRARGYSVSIEERMVGGVAIAAPYFREDGNCRGSVVYTSPRERFDPTQLDVIAPAVVAAARDLSDRLGWRTREPDVEASLA